MTCNSSLSAGLLASTPSHPFAFAIEFDVPGGRASKLAKNFA
jgi:hypothetical protein